MSLDVIILAAGQGTRMKSRQPKVLHPLGGKPIILHSVETATRVSRRLPVMVIGHGAEEVKTAVGEAARYAVQADQLGTGHAVMQTRALLEGQGDHVIVCYADMPLLRPETLANLLAVQQANDGPLSMLTLVHTDPRGFGRIVRDTDGYVTAIVEEAVATPEQLAIRELNVGVYCYDAGWLWENLDRIPMTQPKGEYYITDLVEIAVKQGGRVQAITAEESDEMLGINTRVHLAEAEAALRRRINTDLMLSGVTLIDPATTYIQPSVRVGPDTVILPNTVLEGDTAIGEGCEIGPNTLIRGSQIGDGCKVFGSVVEYATLENDVNIGPYGHLRKGSVPGRRRPHGQLRRGEEQPPAQRGQNGTFQLRRRRRHWRGNEHRRGDYYLQLRRRKEAQDDYRQERVYRQRHHAGCPGHIGRWRAHRGRLGRHARRTAGRAGLRRSGASDAGPVGRRDRLRFIHTVKVE